MQHACAAISVTIATAYATFGESSLQYSINEPGCVVIFHDLLPTVLKVLPHTPSLKYIIYDGALTATLLKQLRQDEHVVLSQDEVRDLGRGRPSIEHLHPKTSDLCCIMYTSGSTGAPKGVLGTQYMTVSAIASVQHLLGHHFQPDHDVFIAFLPLAHNSKYAVELTLCFVRYPIAYDCLLECHMDHRDNDFTAKTSLWFKPYITTVFHLPCCYRTRRVHSSEARDLARGQLEAQASHIEGLSTFVSAQICLEFG